MSPTSTIPTAHLLSPVGHRLGFASAAGVVVVGLAYLGTGIAWLASRAPHPVGSALEPSEPFLTVLEVLVLLGAPLLVVLMAALHTWAPSDRKTATLAALALASVFAALTCANHFVRLTVVRQVGPGAEPGVLLSSRWPSASLAVDFLAWGPLLGLSFLLASAAFRGGPLRSAIRASMVATGAFSLASVLGPALGDLRYSVLGIAGWMGVIVSCALLAVFFARPAGSVRRLLVAAGMSAWAEETVRHRV
ncbi:MAG TPA: hypothetical protein VFI25_09060 [Planctomycetota bacterium]|nr:hypothetical protein [Planctomycetota bacterium]